MVVFASRLIITVKFTSFLHALKLAHELIDVSLQKNILKFIILKLRKLFRYFWNQPLVCFKGVMVMFDMFLIIPTRLSAHEQDHPRTLYP